MDSLLSWYQRKIGAYDLQIWERAVEVREQQDGGMKAMDKRTSSVKPELIDIDLVRGSTFSKNKPQYSWLVVTCQAFIRVLFLPIFIRWWIQQSSKCIMLVFFILYFLHIVVLFLYLTGTDEEFKFVSPAEVTMPPILMLLLGSVHCHVVSTNFRLNVRNDSRRAKQKRTLSSALLEPVVCSSHQSALSLIANSLRAEKHIDNDSSHGTGSEGSEEKDAEGEGKPQKKTLIIGRQRKQTSSNEEQTKELDKSLHTDVKDLLAPNGHVVINGKQSAASILDGKDPDIVEKSSIDKDLNCPQNKKRKRRTVHLEELHSTSSSSNSSNVSGDSDSETSSTNDAETVYQNNIDQLGKSKQFSATALLPCSSQGVDRISVKIWESNQCKKIQASLLDIGGIIRRKAHRSFVQSEMLIIGLCFSIIISSIPNLYRISFHQNTTNPATESTTADDGIIKYVMSLLESLFFIAHGDNVNFSALFVIYAVVLERFLFALTYFVMLCAAHKTFRQRFLFAKYFSHLTSSRRAKKSEVPHFRLDKVENVRLWLSLRSYLRRRGPLRSVDVIVSSAFFIALFLLCFISLQLLHDTDLYLSSLIFWEMAIWLLALAIFLLNFMTIGAQINRKYSNTSILLTEQINLYLQMKHKPHKKEELQRANSVLSIASKLIKEIETPFNIYGLAMNPLLYNITRVVVLSAFSGVVSEILGFKLKIWKIKG